jgi:hypothetical protein
MLSTEEKIMKLTRQLMPTGRAWKMPEGGYHESLNFALNIQQAEAYDAATSILKSLLPDNDEFTEDDATDWERRLGITSSGLNYLEDRKAAILQKLQFPGLNPAKGHYGYIESQLQDAGFDVYVYENLFPTYYPDGYESVPPLNILADVSTARMGMRNFGMINMGNKITYYSQYLVLAQLGRFQMGNINLNQYVWKNKVVNFIEDEKDLKFNHTTNYAATFFIGGPTLGSFANVPASREAEFRQLILRLKQAQCCAFLYINYV